MRPSPLPSWRLALGLSLLLTAPLIASAAPTQGTVAAVDAPESSPEEASAAEAEPTPATDPGAPESSPEDQGRPTRLSAGLTTVLTSLPYDTEFGVVLLGGISHHLGLDLAVKSEALSVFWAGSWWNASLGTRLWTGKPEAQLRGTFSLHYGGGALLNKFTRINGPSEVTLERSVNFGRLDLDGGIRWQRHDTRAFVMVTAGVYTITRSSSTEEFLSRKERGAEDELLDAAFHGVDGAGYSHWFEQGYTSPYLRITLGMDLF